MAAADLRSSSAELVNWQRTPPALKRNTKRNRVPGQTRRADHYRSYDPIVAKRRSPIRQLVCSRCGTLNAATATSCSTCGSERFAPDWVQQLRRVSQAFAVQVTDPYPASSSTDPVLTLYKSWPVPKSFNIPTAAQWEAVRRIVETELATFLGWRTPEEVAKAKADATKADKEAEAALAALTGQDPKALVRIVESLKLTDVPPEELPLLGEALAGIGDVLVGVDDPTRSVADGAPSVPSRRQWVGVSGFVTG